ncbi:hypothetical protein D3C71_1817280 [compost metagenome]
MPEQQQKQQKYTAAQSDPKDVAVEGIDLELPGNCGYDGDHQNLNITISIERLAHRLMLPSKSVSHYSTTIRPENLPNPTQTEAIPSSVSGLQTSGQQRQQIVHGKIDDSNE